MNAWFGMAIVNIFFEIIQKIEEIIAYFIISLFIFGKFVVAFIAQLVVWEF